LYRGFGQYGLLATDLKTFGDAFAKYFNVTQNCGMGVGCGTKDTKGNYDGSGLTDNYDVNNSNGYYTFKTADGMSILLYRYSNCTSNFSNNATGDLANVCVGLGLDVNGNTKGPNFHGRDIFPIFITNGKNGLKLYPQGGIDSNGDTWGEGKYWNGSTKSCYSGNKYGKSCAGRIIEEGWQMNY